MIREIRTAMAQGVENGRSGNGTLPYPGLASLKPEQVPDFYSGCFGLGSRDLQPGDIIAAVNNMLDDGDRQRQFYLGFLAALGRLNPARVGRDPDLEELIAIVPFGVPERLPEPRPLLPERRPGEKRGAANPTADKPHEQKIPMD